MTHTAFPWGSGQGWFSFSSDNFTKNELLLFAQSDMQPHLKPPVQMLLLKTLFTCFRQSLAKKFPYISWEEQFNLRDKIYSVPVFWRIIPQLVQFFVTKLQGKLLQETLIEKMRQCGENCQQRQRFMLS